MDADLMPGTRRSKPSFGDSPLVGQLRSRGYLTRTLFRVQPLSNLSGSSEVMSEEMSMRDRQSVQLLDLEARGVLFSTKTTELWVRENPGWCWRSWWQAGRFQMRLSSR